MLEESQEISFDDSFKYAQVCHALIDEQNPDGYKLAINVLAEFNLQMQQNSD